MEDLIIFKTFEGSLESLLDREKLSGESLVFIGHKNGRYLKFGVRTPEKMAAIPAAKDLFLMAYDYRLVGQMLPAGAVPCYLVKEGDEVTPIFPTACRETIIGGIKHLYRM